ncbi:MAG TPA: diguanylate cyclase [Paraburkholderia sp.]|uniref:diguanylate cyclase n=1 Tax=Paraburkholderia sp. TaxID=1926495 RepID=UPI002B4880FE|nr:diguanylate cyclase [Paraburkholderia sp.]HKR45113.1 diguanylate cyclase [Paraburkholderia sp.]
MRRRALSRAAVEQKFGNCNLVLLSQRVKLAASIDLDCFNKINDEYGHEASDKALVNMASIVRHTRRHSDILMRWVGEELLLIIPNTSLIQAEVALAR